MSKETSQNSRVINLLRAVPTLVLISFAEQREMTYRTLEVP